MIIHGANGVNGAKGAKDCIGGMALDFHPHYLVNGWLSRNDRVHIIAHCIGFQWQWDGQTQLN